MFSVFIFSSGHSSVPIKTDGKVDKSQPVGLRFNLQSWKHRRSTRSHCRNGFRPRVVAYFGEK